MTTMEKLRAAADALRAVIPARGGPHCEAVAVALEALADDRVAPPEPTTVSQAVDTARAKAAAKEVAKAKAAAEVAKRKARDKRSEGGG